MVGKTFEEVIRLIYGMDEKINGLLTEFAKATLAKHPSRLSLPPASAIATRDLIAQQRGTEILTDPGFGLSDNGAPANDDPDAGVMDTVRKLDGNTIDERTAKIDRRIYLKKELTRLKVPYMLATRNVTLEKLLAEALAVELPTPSEAKTAESKIPQHITDAVEKFHANDRSLGYTDEGVEDDLFGAETLAIPPATIDEARVLLTSVSAKFTKDKAFEILHKYGKKLLDLQSPALAALAQECREELA